MVAEYLRNWPGRDLNGFGVFTVVVKRVRER